jgi:hypothetical protein
MTAPAGPGSLTWLPPTSLILNRYPRMDFKHQLVATMRTLGAAVRHGRFGLLGFP